MRAMATLILTQTEIRALLPMRACIDLMSEALASLARGEGQNPLRRAMRFEENKGLIAMMPGSLRSPPAIGLKVVTVLPGNHGTRWDSHQGVVILFDQDHGVPQTILDASEVTAIRTAAVSGLATRLLAREGAQDLAILGSGVQARTHLEAILLVREVRRVRVFSPDSAQCKAFAQRAALRGVTVEPMSSAREAVLGADILCTTTSSREPVVADEWIAAGAHVNAVGSSNPSARELDTATVKRARLFVDRRESALNEAGDFLIPKSEGAIGDEHIRGELGDVQIGKCAGRGSREEVTVFKSLGIAVEDLAAAHFIDRVARERGIGTLVELGGLRD